MSITPNSNLNEKELSSAPETSSPAPAGKSRAGIGLLLGVLFAAAIIEGGYAWHLTGKMQESEQALVAKLDRQQDMIDHLNGQFGVSTERVATLEDELATTKGELGNTRGEVNRTRQYAVQLEKKHNETAATLNNELGKLQEDQVAARGAIGSVNNEVSGVKQDVSKTKDELASTKSQLQRVMGDMGVQSDLIARNHDELNELRARGERDYVEFDLRKSDKAARVGGLGIQLKKTDVKRQKYTLNLIADDRNIEKKDKTVLEPVQFYLSGARSATEIVVNQIYKDRIVGYVSAPKTNKRSQVSAAQPVAGVPSGS
jgi:predicted  nucleic acid-binding Zn-ribbon protein